MVVATNFYGGILWDPASELSGSLGLAGSINANAETGTCCAQAQQGSVPDIAGRTVANSTALILSAAMLLSWLGEQRSVPKLMDAGNAISDEVDAVIDDPSKWT